jgi:parallel beta-helix repeat protein
MANAKTSALTPLVTAEEGDILYIVDDPGGTPVSKKITVANLRQSMHPSVYFVPPSGGDDHAALAAILAAVSDGAVIRLEGAYSISDTLTVTTDRTSIIGHGATITQTGTNKTTINVDSCDGVKFKGIHFVGKGTETPWAAGSSDDNNVCGVRFTTSTNGEVSGCVFTNHAGGSIYLNGATDGMRIIGNTIAGMGSPTISSNDNGSDAGIEGESTSASKSAIIISGNDISGHCFGILMPGFIDMAITGNFIHDIPGQHGMYLANGGDLTISGNVLMDIDKNAIKIQPQEEADRQGVAMISGNTITRCGDCGIIILSTSTGEYYTKNISIVGNNIYDSCTDASNPSAGIFLRRARKAVVEGNRVRKSGLYGIYAHKSEVMLSNNYVSDCEMCALYIDTPQNNTIVNGLVSVDTPLNVGEATGYAARSVVFMTDEASPNQGTVYIGNLHARFEDGIAKTGTGAFFSCLYPNANTLLQIVGPIVDKTGPAYVIGTMAGAVENSIRLDLGNAAPTYGVNKAFLYPADVAAGRCSVHSMTEEGHVIKLFRGAAVADCTNTTDVITQLNALLARLRVTGGNGLIAD